MPCDEDLQAKVTLECVYSHVLSQSVLSRYTRGVRALAQARPRWAGHMN